MARTSSGWWHSPEMLVADGACRCVLDRRGLPVAEPSTAVAASASCGRAVAAAVAEPEPSSAVAVAVAAAAEPSSATPRRWGLGWLHARACQC